MAKKVVDKANKNTKENRNYKKVRTNQEVKDYSANYYLIPVMIVLCIIPLIVRLKMYNPDLMQYSWFPNSDNHADFFLYYKQWVFIIISQLAALILVLRFLFNRKELIFFSLLIPLIIYAVSAMLSTVFSQNISFSLKGSFAQFESVFALLGYCILIYYIVTFTNNESDFKSLYKSLLIGAAVITVIGVFQFIGLDLFASELGHKLILPSQYRGLELNMKFESGRVYSTLYNPNYVGVYAALVIPMILIMILFERKIVNIIVSVILLFGLIMCVYGAKSLTGVLGLIMASICILIFMWRLCIKRYYVTIPTIIIIVLGVLYFSVYSNSNLIIKLKNDLSNSKTDNTLTSMYIKDDYVSLTYNRNEIKIKCQQNDNILKLMVYDSSNKELQLEFDQDNNQQYTIADSRFNGLLLGWDTEISGAFYVKCKGNIYKFTNYTTDNNYYYINEYNKLDQIIDPPKAIFTDYEKFATGRGYIWSRTIPLLKKYILWGSGPDTYVLAFPQQDYLGRTRNFYPGSVLTKPHNLYLQIGVQTGVVSLIAFLVLYIMYFINSVRIYIKGIYNSYYAKIGLAVFVSTISYMFTGLTNDSSICTAPVFWSLLGIGIAANLKAKPLIMEEAKRLKEAKKAKKSMEVQE